MIPTFLKSLAATVRDLVASGKAVHVTNETAAELDLLAGLPWAECQKEMHQDGHCVADVLMLEPITPADLALGWLLASRAIPDYEASGGAPFADGLHEVNGERLKRAAECAELAALSPLASPAENLIKDFVASLGTGEPPRGLRRVYAHDGTREGARAAWGFVVEQLTRSADSIEENTRKPDANIDLHVGRRLLCADRYRRELEAM